MSNTTISEIAEADLGLAEVTKLLHKGRVSARDVAALRREVFADRSLSRAEAEALVGLDRAVRPGCAAWAEFFVEAVTDHVVWDARPTGVVTDAQAEWLLRQVDSARTAVGFAVLVNVLDEAHRVPNGFETAVRQRALAGWPGVGEAAHEGVAAVKHAA